MAGDFFFAFLAFLAFEALVAVWLGTPAPPASAAFAAGAHVTENVMRPSTTRVRARNRFHSFVGLRG